MSVGRPENGMLKDYFGDYKVLMNYCDPRDVYARARLQPGNDWVPVNPEIFVKNWRENVIKKKKKWRGSFPGDSEVKNLPAKETRVRSLGGENPLEKEMATTPVFLPEKFQGRRSLVSYSPWGCKRVGHDLMTKK